MSLGYAATLAQARQIEVDVELVLAVDVSGSMDPDEQKLQRRGYFRALLDPEVLHAIAQGPNGRIALTYVEWGDKDRHRVVVPWTIVSNPKEAAAFARRIAASPLVEQGTTSMSSGLLFAAAQFGVSGARSFRQVVDVSGDGPNNAGPPINLTRDMLVRAGITINGLPITVHGGEGFGWDPGRAPDILPRYYEDCVIGGPGAFLVTVDRATHLETAIRRKLVLEISGLPARVLKASQPVRGDQTDCQIGERNRYPPDPGHPQPYDHRP